MTLTELAHAARRISLYQDFTITFFCIGAPACVAITLLDAGGIVITVAWAAILLGAIWRRNVLERRWYRDVLRTFVGEVPCLREFSGRATSRIPSQTVNERAFVDTP